MDITYVNIEIGETPEATRVVKDSNIVLESEAGQFDVSFAYDGTIATRPDGVAAATRMYDLRTPSTFPTLECASQIANAFIQSRTELESILRSENIAYSRATGHYNYNFSTALVPAEDANPDHTPDTTKATPYAFTTTNTRASVIVLDPFKNTHHFVFHTGGSEKGFHLTRGATPYSLLTLDRIAASLEAYREAQNAVLNSIDAPLRRDTRFYLSERANVPTTNAELDALPILEPKEALTREYE